MPKRFRGSIWKETQLIMLVREAHGDVRNFCSSVNRMVMRGMPHVWVGSVRRYPLADVLEWLKASYGGNC